MGLFKNVGNKVKDAIRRITGNNPIITSRPKPQKPTIPPRPKPEKPTTRPLPDVGSILKDKFEDAVEDVVDGVKDTGKVIGESAKKVGDKIKPVTDEVGEFLEPVGDAIDHVEHFASTGDFGKQVEKLQAEEDEAKFELSTAQSEYHKTAAELISAQSRLHALGSVREYVLKTAYGKPEMVVNLHLLLREAEVDKHGDPVTRFYESIGLDPLADGVKVVRDFGFMMPHTLILKQKELAEARKHLRQNIQIYKERTRSVNDARKMAETTIVGINKRIKALEKELAEAGIEITPASALEKEVLEIENDTRRMLAQSMLDKGQPPEIVATVTGLDLADITAMETAGV
jgi:vacuolar-type H+-ATPase subunit I/STV1